MNAFYKLSIGILGLLVSVNCRAQTFTGNELLEKLRNRDLAAAHFVAGVVEASAVSKSYFEVNPAGHPQQVASGSLGALSQLWGCRPEKATFGQVVDVTIDYLEKHPNIRHLDSTLIIAFAMKDSWPCPTVQESSKK